MAISKLSNSSTISGFKNSNAWDNQTSTGDFYALSSYTVGAEQAGVVTFSNIPFDTYKHLQIRAFARSTGPYTYSTFYMRFGGDATTNYTYRAIYGTGSSAPLMYGRASGGDAYSVTQQIAGANSIQYGFGAVVIDIYDSSRMDNTYTGVRNKVVKSIGGYENNNTGTPPNGLFLNSSTHFNIGPINKIDFYTDGLFDQYSQISLYGIK